MGFLLAWLIGMTGESIFFVKTTDEMILKINMIERKFYI